MERALGPGPLARSEEIVGGIDLAVRVILAGGRRSGSFKER